jgi:hypothetical protein
VNSCRIRIKGSDHEPVHVEYATHPLGHTTIPPQARLLELLLQAWHVQAIDAPPTRLALAVQHQRTHMSESLAASLIAAHERMHDAVIHPMLHLVNLGATTPDLRVHVEIHVQRRVPPLPETEQQERWVGEFGAFSGLQVVDETRVGAHRGVAAPTGDVSSAVLRHVLSSCQYRALKITTKVPYDVKVALMVGQISALLAEVAAL